MATAEQERAREQCEIWVRETGRKTERPRKTLARRIRARDGAEHLTPSAVDELVALALRLGDGERTSEYHAAEGEALTFVREGGFEERKLRAELAKRWPVLDEEQIGRLLGAADVYSLRQSRQRRKETVAA